MKASRSRRAVVGAAPAFALSLFASSAEAAPLDGAHLSLWWAVPFIGLLASIGLGPLIAEAFWHRHYGKIALFWAAGLLIALAVRFGPLAALDGAAHSLLRDYLPFILMMYALYTAAGGVVLRGAHHRRPAFNTLLMAVGAALGSVIGVIAASMIMIRPLLRANNERPRNAHIVVFFIILVSNIGGAMTPLGNPPLFLGFVNGVDFFWPAAHHWPQTLFVIVLLLALFFFIDRWLLRRDGLTSDVPAPDAPTRFSGIGNLLLLALTVDAIVTCGVWKPGVGFEFLGLRIELQDGVRDVAMVLIGLTSLYLTDRSARAANGFEWGPLVEVAKLFAAIFVCIVPLFAMLEAGREGPLASLIALMSGPDGEPRPVAYFWFTGLLSAALDNAPTYLVAFDLAGGDPARLMGPDAATLRAIGLGAAFMGALTYVGNAPNFMVYAIARRDGFQPPSFFGFMLWSSAIMAPILIAVSFML